MTNKSIKPLVQTLFLAACMGSFFWQCGQSPEPSKTETAAAPAPDPVKRGEYLVGIMGCNDCHTPKVMTPQGPAPDAARLLSGYPAGEPLAPIADKSILKDYALFNMSLTVGIGPWGTTYAANLTPDETGLGNWSLDQFKKALREGKAKGLDGGRMLQPPMPWQNSGHCQTMTLRPCSPT